MADLVALATGNLTGSSWGVVDTTSKQASTTLNAQTLSTSNTDSQTFIPGAITVQGVCLRLTTRSAGTITTTMTVHLRNSTTSTNVASVTVNNSLFPRAAGTAESEGGWMFFKFSSPVLLVAGNSYLIRALVSGASVVTIAFARDNTASNLHRLLVTSTTATPAAGDDLFIGGVFDGSANPVTAITAVTVTMDSTAATDYGAGGTNTANAAVGISASGTLAYGTTAATNYLLRVSGYLKVYGQGTFTMGTSGTPCPRDSTMILEFDCAADNDFGLRCMTGSTVSLQGQSRTAAKNVSMTLLTADAAAAATSLTVADDTGWLNGDRVAIAGTNRLATEAEDVALSADAGASTLTVGAITNAHKGDASTKYQAEVLLLTRNVIVRSVSATAMTTIRLLTGTPATSVVSTFDFDWVQFRYISGIILDVHSGSSIPFDHCVVWGLEGGSSSGAWYPVANTDIGASDTVAIRNCGVYHFLSTGGIGIYISTGLGFAGVGDRFVIENFTVIGKVAGGGTAGTQIVGVRFDQAEPRIAISNLRVSCGSYGLYLATIASKMIERKWGPIYIHSMDSTATGIGIYVAADTAGLRFGDVYVWRCDGTAIYMGDVEAHGIRFEGRTQLTGNTNEGLFITNGSRMNALYIADLVCAGDTSFAQDVGLETDAYALEMMIDKGSFGVAAGIFVAHVTADITFDTAFGAQLQAVLRNVVTGSATEYAPTAGLSLADWTADSFIAWERKDGTTTNHLVWTPLGIITYETSTVQDSPGIKLTPSISLLGNTDLRLQSGALRPGRGYMVPVLSGNTVQVAVGVRKDSSYTGNAPRLIVKANSALGIDADAVLDTLTVAHSTWETLTGTTASVTDNGVLEFVVDCDGSAGNVFVNQWASGAATPAGDETTWFDGLPFRAGAAGTSGSPAGGGGGGTRGYVAV